MPTVLRVGGYRFFFVSLDEREPPHIHVRRERKVAKVWLDPIVLQRAGGFSRTEINKIMRLVEKHGEQFLEKWHAFFDS